MQTLRPTVKRDLSLFSVEAWAQGYNQYLGSTIGWRYDVFFHYDGQKVNFHHRLDDFNYFKKVITEKVIADNNLFNCFNTQFQKDVLGLRSFYPKISLENLEKVFDLIGRIMSFYIFVVSDDFVNRRPVAWKSRHLSEGILYEVDAAVEEVLTQLLQGWDRKSDLAHYLLLEEVLRLKSSENVNIDEIKKRKTGYIFTGGQIFTNLTFSEFCKQNDFINPENNSIDQEVEKFSGQVAFPGKVIGKVKKVLIKGDFSKVEAGDIIVAIMTNANFVPIFGLASAIVTDEGGITCHAAIVAREMKKPCIIGTKIATQVLKDGDKVEVDATRGIIRKLK